MKLVAGMWVAVVDGSKGLVLVNEGTALEPKLKVVRTHDIGDNPMSHEQGDDRPGRVFESVGTNRSATEAPDLHQKAEDRFIAEFMRELTADARSGHFEHVVIAAPPTALGTLRRLVEPPLTERIVKDIAADYVKMPIDQIAKAIASAIEE